MNVVLCMMQCADYGISFSVRNYVIISMCYCRVVLAELAIVNVATAFLFTPCKFIRHLENLCDMLKGYVQICRRACLGSFENVDRQFSSE